MTNTPAVSTSLAPCRHGVPTMDCLQCNKVWPITGEDGVEKEMPQADVETLFGGGWAGRIVEELHDAIGEASHTLPET